MLSFADMKALIKNNLQGKKVITLFVITQLILAYMVLVSMPLSLNGNENLKLLDVMPTGYDMEYVKHLFAAIGHEGRSQYLYHQLVVDSFYPLFFGISNCLLLAYFLNKLKKLHSPLIYACYLPLIASVADYMENIGIINLLNEYDHIQTMSVKITLLFSLTKSICSSIFFMILFISLAVFCFQYIKKRPSH